MAKQPLIGFIGPRGSGKSTIATKLERQQGALIASFAQPIKDMLRGFGLSMEQLYGDQKDAPTELLDGKTPRDAMIALGQVWGRQEMGSDIWINAWRKQVLHLRTSWPTHLIVCDDLRQHDELKAFKELGGIAVYLLRPGVEPINHPSETLTAADADVIVRNNDRPEVVATVVLAACKL